MRKFWIGDLWDGSADAGRPRPVPMKKQPETITLRRVDPARWAVLCGAIRIRLEPHLVEVGERLAGSELSLRDDEEQAVREYRLALDAYAAAGKLFDEAAEPVELAGVSALLDIALTHFAVANARHEGKQSPHRRGRCFYNPMHGAASHAGPDASHKPKKRQRRNSPSGRPSGPGSMVPMCAECRQRAQANLPLDILPAAVSVKTGRRSRALVEVPYFVVPHDRSIWSATGYGSLPGSSDAELVRRVTYGEYRSTEKDSVVSISTKKRGRLPGRRG
ncbi:hypothetical protein ABH926_005488 [Catenulispora sp. GP43]|uniref:hypothetical protein n=1 Tax=Catenulispora sp. GP43 TaxID=3156263 RepID=UPI003514D701